MTDNTDIADAIRTAVKESMPHSSQILNAIISAIESQWTPLPPRSHLRLNDADEHGVNVVALRRAGGFPETAEVLTERGGIIRLDADTRLNVGPIQ